MKVQSRRRTTELNVLVGNQSESYLLGVFLSVAIGEYERDYSVSYSHFKCEWELERMAAYADQGEESVSEMIVRELATLPSTPEYLELLDVIFEDWMSVSQQYVLDDPKRVADILAVLVQKRDDMRNFIREEHPLNASISERNDMRCLGEPVGVKEFNASLNATGWPQ